MSYVKNFFIVVGLFLLSQVSMTVYIAVKKMYLEMGQTLLPLVVTVLMLLLIVGNIWLLVFLAKKLGFVTLTIKRFTKKDVGLILGSFVLGRIIAVIGMMLLNRQGTEMTANDSAIQEIFSGENPLLIILLIAISAPIMEEIVFRGSIIGLWFKQFPLIGIIVSSVLFGLIHGPTDWISFVMYVSLGVIFGLVYYKTKRLDVSMSVHFLNNILGALALAFGLI